jgi:two-component system sensor histidine kinase DesK
MRMSEMRRDKCGWRLGVTNVMAGRPHVNLLPKTVVGHNEEDMATLVPPAPTVALRSPKAYREAVATPFVREGTADDLIRLASAGAIAFSVLVPLTTVVLFASFATVSQHFPEAALATALYLPLYVHHVRYGLRGERPRRLPLTLGAMAVVIVGFTPLLGAEWFYTYSAIVASVLVTTRPRLSLPVVACTVVAVGIWAAELRNESGVPLYGGGQAVFFPIAVVNRAAAVFMLVWLVGALRRVQSARVALAEAALESERSRIDMELGASVVSELEEVIIKGVHAEEAARQGSPMVEEELRSLVRGSRLALTMARRIIRQYTIVSPAAELEKAALLLRSAGIEATIELPNVHLPATLDPPLRTALQATVAALLSEQPAGPVILRLAFSNSQLHLETVSPSNFEPAA